MQTLSQLKFGFLCPWSNSPTAINQRIETLENRRDKRVDKSNARIISYARRLEDKTGLARHVSLFQSKWFSVAAVPFNKTGVQEYPVSNKGAHSTFVVPILEGPDGQKSIILLQSNPLPLKGKPVLTLPGGMIGDENTTESAMEAAGREIEEEIGWKGRLTPLGEVNSNYVQTLHVFLATQLVKTQRNPDEYEKVTKAEPIIVPLKDLYAFLKAKKAEGVLLNTNLEVGLSKYIEHCAITNQDTGLFQQPIRFSGRLSYMA